MGIRFHCPNGHKLHVKSFLSGKRAICPKCGVKVMVPAEGSTDDSPIVEAYESEEEAQSDPSGQSLEEDFSPLFAQVEIEPKAPVATAAPNKAASEKPEPQSEKPTPAVKAAKPETNGAAARKPDAIDESPEAVWYVRPPSGGQFGPAAGPVFRGWISEGRVTDGSLVWRAGWPDWKPAGKVFPNLEQMIGPAAAKPTTPVTSAVTSGDKPVGGKPGESVRGASATAPLITTPAAEASSGTLADLGLPESQAWSPHKRRKKENSKQMLIGSIVLMVVVVVLVVVAIVILSSQPQQ